MNYSVTLSNGCFQIVDPKNQPKLQDNQKNSCISIEINFCDGKELSNLHIKGPFRNKLTLEREILEGNSTEVINISRNICLL